MAPPLLAEATPPAKSVVCDELSELRPLLDVVPLAPDEPGSVLVSFVLLPAVPLTPGVLGRSFSLTELRRVPLVPTPLVPVLPVVVVSEVDVEPAVPERLAPQPAAPRPRAPALCCGR